VRKPFLLFTVLVSAVLVACGAALAQAQPPGGQEPERYIVVLEDGVSDPGRAADAMARRYGLGVGFVYSHALKGFSATIPEARLDAVRSEERVAYVEHDNTVHLTDQTLPWGVDRIDADLSSTVAGDGTGSVDGVNAYVLDNGIYRHTDLRVVDLVNFTGDSNNKDCSGHGTHVAGTIAAKDNDQDVVGVAPGVPLTGVKVFYCNAPDNISVIIKGVDWVTANAAKPAVANMSMALPFDKALDDAVRNSAASGIFYSIAAGNEAQPACNYSPGSAGLSETDTNSDGVVDHNDSNGIVTTASTATSAKGRIREAASSNYGECVDIWAPGVGILSTQRGGGITTKSGTSMAAPHVAGGAALYLSSHPGASPSDVEQALKASARTQRTLSKDPSDSRYVTLEYVGGF
jgi:subtilisin family serine protease